MQKNVEMFRIVENFLVIIVYLQFILDPFVKVYLLVNGKRVKKKKTVSRKGSCNPVWNEALNFSLSANNLPNAALEVTDYTFD